MIRRILFLLLPAFAVALFFLSSAPPPAYGQSCSSSNYCSGGRQYCKACARWQGVCRCQTFDCGSCKGTNLTPTPTPTNPPRCTAFCTSSCSNGMHTCQRSDCEIYYKACTSCTPGCGGCFGGVKTCTRSNCSNYQESCSVCPGSGIPTSGWGGACSPGSTAKVPCNGAGHCSVAACQDYNGGKCWYNSGTCYNDPTACSSAYTGYSAQNQVCNSSGNWVNSGSPTCGASCAAPIPNCNTSIGNCGSCSVSCGNGVRQCEYTRHTTNGSNCNRVGVTQPCSPSCGSGFSCIANSCVPNSTIAGNVFVDTNGNTLKDATETNYTGSISINSTGGTVSSAAGTFTVSNLTSGSYTISYTNLPSGYTMTYPVNGPPPSFTVSVGPGCSTGGSNSASCTSGNIINLNYGITNVAPWIQSVGGSLRIDEGFVSRIPTTAVGGPYASLRGSGGTPGLIFTGDSTPDFGQGQSSQAPHSWVVGGTTFPNLYAPIRQGGIVKTSYNFLLAKTRQGGADVTPTDIAQYCSGGIQNCTLSASMPSGIYISNGNLNLNSHTVPASRKYVILVNGDLRMNGRFSINNGATVTFSSSRDILISTTVGEVLPNSTSPTIEGIYSADRSFVVEGSNCTSGVDLRLNIGGNVIANAALSDGSFQSSRNLCAGNLLYPSIYFIERPDFILNTPDFIKQPNFTYQEIAP